MNNKTFEKVCKSKEHIEMANACRVLIERPANEVLPGLVKMWKDIFAELPPPVYHENPYREEFIASINENRKMRDLEEVLSEQQ